MQTRLIAEESLREAERVGVGSGSMEQDARKQILAQWRNDQSGEDAPGTRSPRSPEAMALMGLGVRKVGKRSNG